MLDSHATLDAVVAAALRLSPIEKVRLVERVVSTLEHDISVTPKQSLEAFEGALAHLATTNTASADIRPETIDVKHKSNAAAPLEPTWTDEEINKILNPESRKTPAEVLAWLDENPASEEWGGMKPEDDPAEFIHRMRRRTWSDETDQT